MRASKLTVSTAICICMGLGSPLFVDSAQAANTAAKPAAAPAKACLEDLATFDTQMRKDGNWFGGGPGYGYGPGSGMMGSTGASGGVADNPSVSGAGYMHVRPGYEVRMLMAGAGILAQHGQQATCEAVLATAQGIYKTYSADKKSGNMPMMGDAADYDAKQIAGAKPVASLTRLMRSDELLGTDLRNTKNEALGSVDDLVLSPQTGQIAYLVIARGGIFGFDEKYVPIPWADFAITPDGDFLVLDATKDMLKAAPMVDQNQVMTPDKFATESKTVDAYWANTLPPKS